MLRRLIVILLALALPLNGWAAARVADACAMHKSSMSASAPGHDCCKIQKQIAPQKHFAAQKHLTIQKHLADKSPNPDNISPCKMGQQCQNGTLYFAVTALSEPIFSSACQPLAQPISPHIIATSSAVWRPPRV